MAILFCGIVMSHYTHFNLSPVTQITVQHVFRTAAFVSGKSALMGSFIVVSPLNLIIFAGRFLTKNKNPLYYLSF